MNNLKRQLFRRKNMASLAFASVTALGLVLGGLLPGSASAAADPKATFVGSNSCKMCHSEVHSGWHNTMHPYKLQAADQILPQAKKYLEGFLADVAKDPEHENKKYLEIGAGSGEYLKSIDQLDYVLGGRWKQRFFVISEPDFSDNGGKFKAGGVRIMTAQYNVTAQKLFDDGDKAYEDKIFSRYTSSNTYEDNCIACHTTGYDHQKNEELKASGARFEKGYELVASGVISEMPVGCEVCHGAGSKHAKSASKDDILNPADFSVEAQTQFCGACHGRNGGHVSMAGRSDPINPATGHLVTIVEIEAADGGIYDFTKILSVATNKNVWKYKDGYSDRPNKPRQRFYPDGRAASHRGQYLDMEQGPHYGKITCTACHTMHSTTTGELATIYGPRSNKTTFEQSCAACHDDRNPSDYMPLPVAFGGDDPTVGPRSSTVQDERSHTFLPGGAGNPHPDIPEAN